MDPLYTYVFAPANVTYDPARMTILPEAPRNNFKRGITIGHSRSSSSGTLSEQYPASETPVADSARPSQEE